MAWAMLGRAEDEAAADEVVEDMLELEVEVTLRTTIVSPVALRQNVPDQVLRVPVGIRAWLGDDEALDVQGRAIDVRTVQSLRTVSVGPESEYQRALDRRIETGGVPGEMAGFERLGSGGLSDSVVSRAAVSGDVEYS